MKPAPFEYERPGTVDQAVKILAQSTGGKVLAGGQSLIPLLNLRLSFPEVLVDINRIPNLYHIAEDEGVVRVGALVRQSTFGDSSLVQSKVPLAAQCVSHVGHYVTRNQGTVAGSLAHSDSRGELPVALVALGGRVRVVSEEGQREIEAADLFVTDFTTSMSETEILVESSWPVLGPEWGFAFSEFALRHGDYALGMIAVAIHVHDGVVDQATIVAGSVADRPLILEEASRQVLGRPLDEHVFSSSREAAVAAVNPADDIHATGEYKRHLIGVLVDRALRSAWKDSTGGING
ncbi:MAG: xanthine dehydrogenase family protein subunit M [Acidimicrobiia bacterium]